MTTRVGKGPNGQDIIDMTLDSDVSAQLEMLQASPLWHAYKKKLIEIKLAYLEMSMSCRDPYELKEKVSIAAGINLAVNQLDGLIAVIKNKAKRGAGDTEKPDGA